MLNFDRTLTATMGERIRIQRRLEMTHHPK